MLVFVGVRIYEAKEKTATVTLRISEEEKQKLFDLAKKRDIPVSQLIREICREIFNKEEN